MKNIFISFTIVFLFSSFINPVNINSVIAAIKSGNAGQVARYFDNNVEISMPEKSNNYSKVQGEIVLKDFFIKYPVKGFEVIHIGENTGSQYCIGTLQTKGGSFRTTIFMKQRGEQQFLQEIKFENR